MSDINGIQNVFKETSIALAPAEKSPDGLSIDDMASKYTDDFFKNNYNNLSIKENIINRIKNDCVVNDLNSSKFQASKNQSKDDFDKVMVDSFTRSGNCIKMSQSYEKNWLNTKLKASEESESTKTLRDALHKTIEKSYFNQKIIKILKSDSNSKSDINSLAYLVYSNNYVKTLEISSWKKYELNKNNTEINHHYMASAIYIGLALLSCYFIYLKIQDVITERKIRKDIENSKNENNE